MNKALSKLTLTVINADLMAMTPEWWYVRMVSRAAQDLAKERHRLITRIAWQIYYWDGVARLFEGKI